ncbi:Uncharacterised protein [BD1-7 clade bacterium]|uniref:Peptidase M12B domain-containing protein n=1 Tax=BD1-7 clade bacterium TaxID=2029982 RepID=A0A5S9N7C1_9GAMM|nr:Uncharacterised protein [BD1-7 clade bacterium]
MNTRLKRRANRAINAIGLTLSMSFVHVAMAETRSIDIDGQSYPLQVEVVDTFAQGTDGSQSATHYAGAFTDDINGWVRFSEFSDGSLAGLAVINGQLHEINTAAAGSSNGDVFNKLVAGSLSDGDQDATCGVDGSSFDLPNDGGSHSALLVPAELSSSYSDLCGTLVDGVCIAANLEVVYDQSFINTFNSAGTANANVTSNANALLNMVEGYYANQFNMRFNVLTSRFITDSDNTQGGGQFVSSTTVSSALLEEVTSRKCDQFRGSGTCGQVLSQFYRSNGSTAAKFDHLQQERALLHYVTGRDFDGSTIGVAWIDGACSNFAVGTGTSQLSFSGGSVNMARTAATIAHEIGHNLNASHDGDPSGNSPSCPTSGFVMNSQLGVTPTEFSSCSEDVVSTKIASQSSIKNCYLPPVNVAVVADAAPASITENTAFTQTYAVSASTGFGSPDSASVTGTVTNASINTASLAGAACTVAGNGLSFTCAHNNLSVSQQLAVDLTPQQNATLSVSAVVVNAFETSTANNTVATNFTVGAGTTDPDPDPQPEPEPTPAPAPKPPAFGAINLMAAFSLLLVLYRRRLV